MQEQDEREHTALIMTPPSSDSAEEHCPLGVVKRKQRTKRHRHPSQSPAMLTTSSASSSESTTTEEEDMAHCLILLAQGCDGAGHPAVDSPPPSRPRPQSQPEQPLQKAPAPARSERYTSRKYTEAATMTDGGKAGFYVYECKTCNKCFPTFQALGGHRASHKKPRIAATADENSKTTTKNQPTPTSPPLPPSPVNTVAPDFTTVLSLNNAGAGGKLRTHECSICGAEFASGQALGGHMRRHRPLHAPERVVTAVTTDIKKEGSINLELDLNLPAPSDEESVSLPPPPSVALGLAQFDDGKKGLPFTASALVDCHY